MAVDLSKDDLIRLCHVGRHLPDDIHAATAWRWATKVCAAFGSKPFSSAANAIRTPLASSCLSIR